MIACGQFSTLYLVQGLQEVIICKRFVGTATPDGTLCGLVHERLELRAGSAICDQRKALEIDCTDWDPKPAHVETQDLLTLGLIGQIDVDDAVKPTRTRKRRVERIVSVCRRDDQQALTCLGEHTIHAREQLIERLNVVSIARLVVPARAERSDGVNLVNEDDGRLST
jgi:hypothetical protein